MSDAPISTLPGIGPVTQRWLDEAGIGTIRDLRSMGAVEIYRRLKFMMPRQVTLDALYSLEAALRGCHWMHLPPEVRDALRDESGKIDAALLKGTAARCV